jgi:hypothetical protein
VSIESVVAGALAALVLVYLVYTLAYPEKL